MDIGGFYVSTSCLALVGAVIIFSIYLLVLRVEQSGSHPTMYNLIRPVQMEEEEEGDANTFHEEEEADEEYPSE